MRNYFTDYEFRLEVARRYPVIGRIVVITVIFVGICGIPIAAMWPLPTWAAIGFPVLWLLGVLGGLGYYFLVERDRGTASLDAGSSPRAAGKLMAAGLALWLVWFAVLWVSSSWPAAVRIAVLVVFGAVNLLLIRQLRPTTQRSG